MHTPGRRASMSTRHVRCVLAATAVVISTGMLSACSTTGDSVSIPLGSEQLEQCPPRVIDAEELSLLGEPRCNLMGSTVVLPDGRSMDIEEVGRSLVKESTSEPGVEYLIVNWGIPGAAISVVEAGRVVDQWQTSPDAGELQRQLHLISGYEDD